MADSHIKSLGQIVKSCFLRNDLPQTAESINAYTCGFADGASWYIRKLQAIGIEVEDMDLFLTDATQGE